MLMAMVVAKSISSSSTGLSEPTDQGGGEGCGRPLQILADQLPLYQSGVADYARHLHRVIPTLFENIPPGLTSKVPLLYTDAPDVHCTLVGKGKQKGIR